MIPWLSGNTSFPTVETALREPNGLLAAGGDLTPARLLDAYRHGIFPWFSPGDPVLWWSPDPRMVLIPAEFKLSRSLARVIRNGGFEVRMDTAFETVMRACAAPRAGQNGTWIQEDMIAAYCALHELGCAHSVETWRDGDLVGGLYGVAIGRMFYGESMFSREANASKVALAHLARQLDRWEFGMIDCQMNTPHLASLGAREIPRAEFVERLQELVNCAPVTRWRFDADLYA
ncbi:MAG TPA: leucyl/phenylalanyl-tRNA--protein transferase [Gallionella sp.]|nr:leucyl/phenylalanyl-tRNA--protein transferase [Gallionella sp.]